MQIHIANTIESKFGGEGIAAHGLSWSIASENLKVLLITREMNSQQKSSYESKPHYTIIFLQKHFFPIQIIKDFFVINSILKKHRSAVIHLHGMWTVLLSLVAFLCILKKTKFIISPHGCLEPWALNHKMVKK